LLVYKNPSFNMTVRPFNVVYCFSFALVSLKVGGPSPLTCFAGGADAETFPGMRMTWLARKSSEFTRSEYSTCVSRSRFERRKSVVGTKRIFREVKHRRYKLKIDATHMVIDGRALRGNCAPEEGP
jgi:hypothetical protein